MKKNNEKIKLNRIVNIRLEDIYKNSAQPRKSFDPEKVRALADSIEQNGLLQPLSVRRCDKGYELIAGERRLRALYILGRQTAPCVVVNASACESAILAIIENIQREDLNVFEQAQAIGELITRLGVTQTELAQRLSLSQSAVANKLRLLKLSKQEQHTIIENALTERHARALVRITDDNMRKKALKHIISAKLNVSQTEKYVEKLLTSDKKGKTRLVFKDLRIFTNTINMAIETMRKSGVKLSATKGETDGFIEYTIRIPKPLELANSK